jgi:flagellar hook-basal body complex protein FliE
MDVNATLAYTQARPATAPEPGAGDIASGLARVADDFVRTLSEGEATARAAMTGRADPYALVQALSATELAIETAVTVRDKVVEAYQEILRMPV